MAHVNDMDRTVASLPPRSVREVAPAELTIENFGTVAAMVAYLSRR